MTRPDFRKREYRVRMVALAQASNVKHVLIVAFTADLAINEANRLNPDYIGTHAKVYRIVK